jgi:hypothetical protein
MSIYEILGIIVAVISLLVNLAWAIQIQRAKRIIANALEFKQDYIEAIADQTLTDAERLKLAEHAIPIIEDVLAIFQTMSNAFWSIIGIVKRK